MNVCVFFLLTASLGHVYLHFERLSFFGLENEILKLDHNLLLTYKMIKPWVEILVNREVGQVSKVFLSFSIDGKMEATTSVASPGNLPL